MVERVERFQPELNNVLFVIWCAELLVQRQIDRLQMRRPHGIPPEIAERPGGRYRE